MRTLLKVTVLYQIHEDILGTILVGELLRLLVDICLFYLQGYLNVN